MTARKSLNSTERKLVAMLTENTGVAMMDSGGTNGRAWQRNQGRNFKAEPATILSPVADYVADGSNYEPEVTHNVFHFLCEALSYDDSMNRRYQAFARKRRGDQYEMEIMDSFMDYLRDKGHEIAGMWGDGEPFTVNTYNGEDLVSQTLQYLYFSCDRTEYVLLQIHGGADVRGGYTNAVAFQSGDNGGTAIYDNAKATIWTAEPTGDQCDSRGMWERPFWSTDDAWNWYFQGSTAGAKLNTYEISRNPEHKGDGEHVFIDADGRAHCPQTGLLLEAGY